MGHRRFVHPLLDPLTASDQSSFWIAAPTSAASRAVVTGLVSQPTAAAVRIACLALSYMVRNREARSLNAERRAVLIALRTASVSAGRLASTSPAIDRSVGAKRWKSW